MSKTLYLECTFGISGDMFVGSLLDLGADEKKLEQALASLPVKGFHTCISRVKKSGLDACDFAVLLDEQHENHDHDMEYLHGAYTKEHRNETKEQTQEAGHAYKHEHRNLKQICEIIEAADMSEHAKQIAERIFTVLAEAEAKVHGESMEQVHFHEVGAVDSIVDIVAAAVCLDSLQIEEVIVPMLSEGQGTVCCQHGNPSNSGTGGDADHPYLWNCNTPPASAGRTGHTDRCSHRGSHPYRGRTAGGLSDPADRYGSRKTGV